MTDAACVVAEAELDDEIDGETDTAHDEEAVDTSHLDDMADGCGCAEVWEHLSEQRGE